MNYYIEEGPFLRFDLKIRGYDIIVDLEKCPAELQNDINPFKGIVLLITFANIGCFRMQRNNCSGSFELLKPPPDPFRQKAWFSPPKEILEAIFEMISNSKR